MVGALLVQQQKLPGHRHARRPHPQRTSGTSVRCCDPRVLLKLLHCRPAHSLSLEATHHEVTGEEGRVGRELELVDHDALERLEHRGAVVWQLGR